ncbi:hypothetical protein L6164_021340 [Bauhinia variegata]|uniref:Uncharacterized protein n=1 Tax=Bauhinia variegata TaxID=167791 RepID=A0ACB9MY79_BAUVA|nr:hypothetical protein L6164_021340 [Bauhinia variegata]
MISKFMSPFKLEGHDGKQQSKKIKRSSAGGRCHVNSSPNRTTVVDVVGLRFITHIANLQSKSNNIVMKSAVVRKGNQTRPVVNSDFCYLKTCDLCNKKLSPEKDIYMYRGDQGFCSIECRNRQIVLDEMRELESSTKQMVASQRHCWNDARRETRLILEDLRLQRLKSNAVKQNHWAIVS